LEAMACGTPVIASEVGGLAYLVRDGETGFTVPSNESDKLCEKLFLLLSDSHLHRTMGMRAAEEAQSYSWDKIAAQIVNVYEDVLGMEEGSATEPLEPV
jgi:D-inositol-3-phosphate glycosyltransferase